jgi:hypothetical protein
MKSTVTVLPVSTWLFPLLLMIASCGQSAPAKVSAQQPKPLADTFVLTKDTVLNEVPEEDLWEECYLVVADTGTDYYTLRGILEDVKHITGQEIDTFGRYYNVEKDSLILPEDDADEMWAGAYFPRREMTPAGSIEYLDAYRRRDTSSRMLAAVAGLFAEKRGADSMLALIRKQYQGAWVMKTEVYMGCMH